MTLNDVVLMTGLTTDAVQSLLRQPNTTMQDVVNTFGLNKARPNGVKPINRTVETDDQELFDSMVADDTLDGDEIIPPVPFTPIGVPAKKRGRPSQAEKAAKLMAQQAVTNVVPKRSLVPQTTEYNPVTLKNHTPLSAKLQQAGLLPKPTMRSAGSPSVYKSQVHKVHSAIQLLRQYNTPSDKGITSRGIHVVYSHFNEIMPEKLGVNPGEPLHHLIALMAQRGDIELQPRRGGPMIYLPGEGPKRSGLDLASATNALSNL